MPLHPQAADFLQALAAQKPPAWNELPVDEARELFRSLDVLFGDIEPIGSVRDIHLAQGFRIRVYHPDPSQTLPAVLYFHGGGWVLGDCDTHDSLCRRMANQSSCCVVSVDYRCAPEHKFPEPLDDCATALEYVLEHAGDLNIDSQRIGVAGDSAGGNLAAALAVAAPEKIKCQLLIYPVIAPDFETSSYREFAVGFGLTRESMIYFWQCYLDMQENAPDPAAALNRANLSPELPRAHVMTAEYDVLRDEGEAYAEQLRAAGVPTSHKRYDGMLHGFVHFAAPFDDGKRARDEAALFLKDALQS